MASCRSLTASMRSDRSKQCALSSTATVLRIFRSIVQATKDHVNVVPGGEGTQGELLVKSPLMFKGYYNNSAATSESFIEGKQLLDNFSCIN